MVLPLIFLALLSAHAQMAPEEIDCSKVDEKTCLTLKAEESKRVSRFNEKLYMRSLSDCTPVLVNIYHSGDIVKTSEIIGKVEDRCRITVTHVYPPLKFVCNFSRRALELASKPALTYTQEEKLEIDLLQKQQCKGEVIGTGRQAQYVRKMNEERSKSIVKKREQLKTEMLVNMRKQISKLQGICNTENSTTCEELAELQKTITEECKNQDSRKACEGAL